MVSWLHHAVFSIIQTAKRDFLPRQDAVALVFHDRFTSELVANDAALGFRSAEIAGVIGVTAVSCGP